MKDNELKAQELRMGNLVWNEYLKENRKVDYLDIRDHFERRLYTPFQGISITGEWLLKFGFERHPKDDKRFFWGHYGYNMVFDEEASNWDVSPHIVVDGFAMRIASVQFVHQLQNLYFALTDTEIEIK